MRIRNLMGLFAIGGAVAYANKKRGGDWSLTSFKETLQDLGDTVKQKLTSLSGQSSAASNAEEQDADDSDSISKSPYESGFGGYDTVRSVRH